MREAQGANGRPSRLHWKVAPPSVAEKENVAVLLRVTDGGCSTSSVPGGCASTLQRRSAGVASALPASSWARTRSVCLPARRAERTRGVEQLTKGALSREQ